MKKNICSLITMLIIFTFFACKSETIEAPSLLPELSHDQAMSLEENYWTNYLLMRKATETLKRDIKSLDNEKVDPLKISDKIKVTYDYLEKSRLMFKESNTFDGVRFGSYKLLEDYCQINSNIADLFMKNIKSDKEDIIVEADVLLEKSKNLEDSLFSERMEILSFTELTEAGLSGYIEAGLSQIEDIITLVNFEPIHLSNGNFIAGKDFPSGIYNIYAVKGKGNVSSDNMFEGGINAIMGIADEDDFTKDFYQEEYQNIIFPEGCKLTITNVEIRIVLVDLY